MSRYGMVPFNEYLEVKDVADRVCDEAVHNEGLRDWWRNTFSRGYEGGGDRFLGTLGELGKGVLRGAYGAIKEPLGGIARGLQRSYYGKHGTYGTEQRDLRAGLASAKETLFRHLMQLEYDVRKEEIEKLKNMLDSIKDMTKDSDATGGFATRLQSATPKTSRVNYKQFR